jgi:predicted amidohydrolase YtcJ
MGRLRLQVFTNYGPSRLQVDQLLIEWVAQRGYTSVHDAGALVGPALGPCQDLVEAGRLKLRIYAFATVNGLQHPVMGVLGAGLRSRFGDERLRLSSFKVMTDGSSSGPTAATREPHTSNGQDYGILYWNQDGLDDLIGRAHRQGFQCTVHAVGDRAIEHTLKAMARAQREFPRQGLRHRIEHCAICPPDLQDRLRAQHIVPAMQPAFFWEFGDGSLQHYGHQHADTMVPVKSLIAAGVAVAGSSDAPVTHYAPLFGIEQALTRRTMAGDVRGPDERVDLTSAIRMYTIHGAFASFEEGFKGSLEVGKVADLVALAEDLSRIPVERLRDVGVVMIVVGGEVVYEA